VTLCRSRLADQPTHLARQDVAAGAVDPRTVLRLWRTSPAGRGPRGAGFVGAHCTDHGRRGSMAYGSAASRSRPTRGWLKASTEMMSTRPGLSSPGAAPGSGYILRILQQHAQLMAGGRIAEPEEERESEVPLLIGHGIGAARRWR